MFDDLVAVGSSTGKVELWRLESNRYAKNNVVYGGPLVSLQRSSRSCNALAFSPVKPNLLAVGLDKVRGDPSLLIWDIEVAVATQIHSGGRAQGAPGTRPSATSNDRSLVNHYAMAEVISSVAFLPSSTDLVVAGVSNLWLRLFDLRSAGPVSQASAKVHGIVTDPFDMHRFASYGGEGSVSVWDSRKMTLPLLTFTLKDASADGARYYSSDIFSCVEFSPVRRGVLATLTRDANHVRFWDIQTTPSFESSSLRSRDNSKENTRSSKLSRLSWAAPSTILPWNAPVAPPQSSMDTILSGPNAVLSDTRRSMPFSYFHSCNDLIS